MLIPQFYPLKCITHSSTSNLYATPLVNSLPSRSLTLPTREDHFLLCPESIFFEFLWWNLSHAALYWSPVSLSPSLCIQAGTLLYLILPVPIKLNASLHITSPHTWWINFLNLPFLLGIFYSIISKWSEKTTIGNECKKEWFSGFVCILVWKMHSESASVVCLCHAVAWASESACRAGCEKHTLQKKFQRSKVYPQSIARGSSAQFSQCRQGVTVDSGEVCNMWKKGTWKGFWWGKVYPGRTKCWWWSGLMNGKDEGNCPNEREVFSL